MLAFDCLPPLKKGRCLTRGPFESLPARPVPEIYFSPCCADLPCLIQCLGDFLLTLDVFSNKFCKSLNHGQASPYLEVVTLCLEHGETWMNQFLRIDLFCSPSGATEVRTWMGLPSGSGRQAEDQEKNIRHLEDLLKVPWALADVVRAQTFSKITVR